jgi:hypothetical protein
MSQFRGFLTGVIRRRKKEFLFLLLCAALPLAGSLPQPASDWAISFPLVAVYLVSAYLAGKAVLAGFDLFSDNRPALCLMRILCGFGVFSLYIMALGLLGLASHLIEAYSSLAAALVFYYQIRKRGGEKTGGKTRGEKKESGKTGEKKSGCEDVFAGKSVRFIFFSILVVCIAALFLLAPVPEGFHDSLLYHLALPQQVFLTGRLAPMEHNFTTFLPLNSEMLYVPLAANDYAARLLQFAFALMTLGLVVFSFPRHYRLPAALIGITALGFFQFAFTSVTTLPEINVAAYALAGWLLLEKYLDNQKKGYLATAGFMFGIAGGVKYQGLILAAGSALALFVLMIIKKRGVIRSLLPPVTVIFIALVVFSPWMIRSVLLTGNPVFPVAERIFGAKNLSPEDTDVITSIWSNIGSGTRSVSGFFLMPLKPAMEKGGTATLVLMLLPATFLLLRKKQEALGPVIILLGFYSAWFLWAPNPRYFVPAVPFILLLGARGIALLVHYKKVHFLFILALLALFLINFIPVLAGLYVNLKPFDFYAGGLNRDAYEERLLTSPFAAFCFMNENTPRNSKVLLIGDSRGYNLKRQYHASSPYERQLISDYLAENSTAKGLAADIKKAGYSFIIVNFAEWKRTRDFLKIPAMNFAPKGTPEGNLLLELFRSLQPIYQDKKCVIYAL